MSLDAKAEKEEEEEKSLRRARIPEDKLIKLSEGFGQVKETSGFEISELLKKVQFSFLFQARRYTSAG